MRQNNLTDKAKKVSIVIPNFNGKELLEKNLPFVIKASDNIKNNIKEIIVVDDFSSDDSLKYLTSEFKNKIKLIKHTKNRGFSASVNTGVRATNCDVIVLLNSDVAPSEDFLESVLPHFDDPKVFAVSFHERGYGYSKASFEDGIIKQKTGPELKTVSPSFYVSGGSGAFRKSIWKELSGLDERLLSPFYWEDIDLCYRSNKRGYKNLWEPNSNVAHNHESTISKLPRKKVERIRERNQLLVIWKNIHSTNLIRKHIKALLSRILRHPGYIRIVFLALLKIGLVLRERKREIKESKVSDEAVFSQYS